MRILYIDTTSNYLYTGIVEEDNLVCEIKKKFDHDLSTMALSMIAEMFNKNDIKPIDINKIILVNGPGSFTGCRIGITIAKVYAWTLNIPISVISSLEAMATTNLEYGFYVPVIDARRDYVYAGIYDNEGNSIMKDQYMKKSVLEMAANGMTSDYTYITNDNLELDGEINSYNPDILKIVERYKDREDINPHLIDANYLKLTEAEENLNDRNC
ncbi:MAG: tRNA (adenosine(37)-N6)-threonylcarbamoyltransferase complex dimerization subunit type 1 TsaB [Bacilli bacterium]|nr:tRNA (adenosine(37)-N6)-threonylcarbamoyltransferase complex dimerization subunit type 1 TsaB [Bacilli bacterium]